MWPASNWVRFSRSTAARRLPTSRAAHMVSLVRLSPNGLKSHIPLAMSTAWSTTSSSSTTRETSPIRSASSASTFLPVRRISAELEVPTARGSSQLTPSSVPAQPVADAGAAEHGRPAGQPDVGTEGEAHAAPVGRTLDGGHDGLGDRPHGRDDAAHVLHGPHAHAVATEVLGARGEPGVLELEPRAEGPAGTGQDDHPAAVVGGHLARGRRRGRSPGRRTSS